MTLAGQKLEVKRSAKGATASISTNSSAGTYVMVQFVLPQGAEDGVQSQVADVFLVSCVTVANWRVTTNHAGVRLDPRRYYYSMKLPTGLLEVLTTEADAS